MSELRQDQLTGRWILISPKRRRPPGIRVVRTPNKKKFRAWLVEERAVPDSKQRVQVHRHLYPPFDRPRANAQAWLILLASHSSILTKKERVAHVYIDTLARILNEAERARPAPATIALFRNEGASAGATVDFLHHQVWSLPEPTTAATLERAWVRSQRKCPTCRLISHTRRWVVAHNKHALLLVRPAGRFQGELVAVPRRHATSITKLSTAELHALMDLVVQAERLVGHVFKGFGHNESWRTWKPTDKRLHTRVEIMPRVNSVGGLEAGEGTWVNPFAPEQAVVAYKKIMRNH